MFQRYAKLGVFSLVSSVVIAACSGDDAGLGGAAPDASTPADGGAAPRDASGPRDATGIDATGIDATGIDATGIDATGIDATADASACGVVSGIDVTGPAATAGKAIARAVCARLATCCAAGDRDAFFGQFKGKPYTLTSTPSAADCERVLAEQLAIVHGKWAGSVQRSRATFDSCRAASCVAAIDAASCGPALSIALYDAACFDLRANEIFRKTAGVGSDCQDIADSTFNGECDVAKGFCGSTAKCEAWRATGETCSFTPRAFCAPGLSCDGGSATSPGHCSSPPQAVALGAACSARTVCPATAYCDFLGTGKCEPKKADGAACADDEECLTSRPYSCFPYGAGVCGSAAYCGGSGDGGAGDAGSGDSGPADGGQGASFTIARTDDAVPVAGVSVDAAQRDRVTLQWDAPGATTVAIDGAGPLVAVVRDGVPSYDDMTAASGLNVTRPTTSGGVYGFRQAIAASIPFQTTLLGDVWNGRVSISPHGVMTRGLATSLIESNSTLPLPKSGLQVSEWAQGTLAPFFDRRLDSNTAGTSVIRTGSFGSGLDQRFVVEWSDMTTGATGSRRAPAHITFQLALYANGRVEYRYRTLSVDPTDDRPDADLPLVRGQAATIGIAQSYDASPTPWALPLSIHRASLAQAGVTYTFYPSGALPPSGRAVVVLAPSTGTATFTLKAAGFPDAAVRATLAPMYVATRDTQALRDITGMAGATTVPFGGETTLPIDLPFSVDVFHEGWRSLAVSRAGAIGPWGVSSLELGLNGRTIPDPYYPNGFLAALYSLNGASWCSGAGVPSMTWLVEGSAPSRAVTILLKALNRCGTYAAQIDLEIVVHENGDVEYLYDNLTSAADEVTGKGVLVGAEGANGDIAAKVLSDQPGQITSGSRVTLTRHP